jgi:hypothetical protein
MMHANKKECGRIFQMGEGYIDDAPNQLGIK